jgi:hypothetical protein
LGRFFSSEMTSTIDTICCRSIKSIFYSFLDEKRRPFGRYLCLFFLYSMLGCVFCQGNRKLFYSKYNPRFHKSRATGGSCQDIFLKVSKIASLDILHCKAPAGSWPANFLGNTAGMMEQLFETLRAPMSCHPHVSRLYTWDKTNTRIFCTKG